jgi:Ca-activated chloride channel family protein
MPRRLGIALALSAGLATAGPFAQQIFRAGTDVVLLNVSSLDAKNHAVGGLTRSDFVVFEDGLPQDITVFSHDPQPIALSLLLDTSVSMDRKLAVAQGAAIGFVDRLGPRDICQLIDFDTMARIAQPFTSDHQALQNAIRKTQAGGRTSLYDAVYIALDQLNRAPPPADNAIRRQAIVLLSDGEDTSSHKEYDEVTDLSKRSDVIVFSIGLRARDESSQSGWNEAEFVLRTLAQETGGRAFFVSDIAQLPAIYGQIADELSNQYTLGYRSKNQRHDGLWRRVSVQIPHGGAVALTKSGYFAPSRDR